MCEFFALFPSQFLDIFWWDDYNVLGVFLVLHYAVDLPL
jgi:hypothetical protein